ncbi:PREDICTED: uncharacterized protein LOC106114167 [Papilio xuthus]|uniref:Uncharacterized protein LOC106114167 n=1 Tax=Papilio xuthus TaxID=66420 RepID=A0AAJ7E4S4_PAPXU|nr:PREDICTED: uncharacterized protein LOC106114167 [Papilio xuthus]
MFFLLSWYVCVICMTECAVLDPALYLQPSPPIRQADEYLWSQSMQSNVEAIPINVLASIDGEDSMPKARTFWPKLRTDYKLGSIHIPLTFSVSGTYGNFGDGGSAVGSSYASISELGSAKVSKPTLAGSGYDNYNSSPTVVRIYGSSNKPVWSGWGNGKWGHYGKG